MTQQPRPADSRPAPAGPPGGGRLAAVVFDVDGTLVDSERDGHRVAFNAAFAAAGLPYQWEPEEYGHLLAVTGGRRRLAGYLEQRGHPAEEAGELARRLHLDKTQRFRALVLAGEVPARPGVVRLVGELRAAGVRTAVATTGTRDWVEPLLARHFPPGSFELVLTGTEVPSLKPDPAVYLAALDRLGLPPEQVLAVEDSPPGLRAALAAGLGCLVVVNDYTRDAAFPGAAAVLDGFGPTPAARQLAGAAVELPGGQVTPDTLASLVASRPAGRAG